MTWGIDHSRYYFDRLYSGEEVWYYEDGPNSYEELSRNNEIEVYPVKAAHNQPVEYFNRQISLRQWFLACMRVRTLYLEYKERVGFEFSERPPVGVPIS